MFREANSSLEPWLKKEDEYIYLFAHVVLELDRDTYHDALRSVALMKIYLLRGLNRAE